MERFGWCLGLLVGGFVAAGCESTLEPGEGGAGGGEVGGGEVGGGEVGGAGGNGECSCPSASVSIVVSDPEGFEVEGDVDLEGSITSPSPGVWEIDTCPPNADCLASIYELRVTVPGLTPVISEGAFVTLASIDNNVEEIQPRKSIELRNLPIWGGAQNPVSSGGELLLFANEGMGPTPPLPITVVPHCSDPGDDPNGLQSISVYDLQAQADNGNDGGPFTVEGGQVQLLTYADGVDAGDYMLANVSVCDGYEWYALQYGIARVAAAEDR